jgi:hypothetical protein
VAFLVLNPTTETLQEIPSMEIIKEDLSEEFSKRGRFVTYVCYYPGRR